MARKCRSLERLGRAELLRLARLGQRFEKNHCGRRPGFLRRYITQIVREVTEAKRPPTFAELLFELELAAARRDIRGEGASPVERVDRIFELLTIHLPRKGRIQVPFGTLRNLLTAAKKDISRQLPNAPKP